MLLPSLRHATVMTSAYCELILVYKDDFKAIWQVARPEQCYCGFGDIARKCTFLRCSHLDFRPAATAQNDKLLCSFHRSYRRSLTSRLGQETQHFRSDTYRLVIVYNNIRCVQEKQSLQISTFTEIYGDGEERWPTEVTSNTLLPRRMVLRFGATIWTHKTT